MASAYQHQPLSSRRSIRVFTVLPSSDQEAPVQGTLSEIILDLNPSFEALSYFWGSPEPGNAVSILAQSSGGTPETSRLQVTPNCLSALRNLRLRSKSRKLWVDVIC